MRGASQSKEGLYTIENQLYSEKIKVAMINKIISCTIILILYVITSQQ